MPDTALADNLHAEKYRSKGESFREWSNRVASALKDSDENFKELRDLLLNQRFLPAGRVQAAMGSPRRVTAYNCFVSAIIQDTFTDGPDSIMGVASQAAQTMRMGGGIGYDFSTLRPNGARISTLDSKSSGPIAFMDIFDSVCRVTASAGNRRGAQMGVLRIDHPDIEEFIRAKQNTNKLTGFNVSIAVTDEFMKELTNGGNFTLKWGGRNYSTINAKALWEEIMRSTWDWAEPGVLFIDKINEMNNLHYCETISATNPCAEQALPPNGACLLGSFNLVKYLFEKEFNWSLLEKDISLATRAMDNVIDRTIYPLEAQEIEAKKKRRMGLGVTGLANAGEALGFRYGSPDFVRFTARVLKFIRDNVYKASALLAKEKGVFPLFSKDAYLSGKFIQTLPANIRDLIALYGIRNSHLTSIAPTGTISLCADNVSSGVEPVYKYSTERTILGENGPEVFKLEDYGVRTLGVYGKTTEECSVADHLGVLATAQKFVDSAVSKTINIDPNIKWDDFKNIYYQAWLNDCKGVTTFNPNGKRMGIFAPTKDETTSEGGACYINPVTGDKSCEE